MLDLSPEREACIDFCLNGVSPDISNLVNLRVLMLDTNQLSELPREIGQLPQLERLSISNNHLRSIPDSISNLQRLTALHAANNRFAVVTIKQKVCIGPVGELLYYISSPNCSA